MNNPTAHHNDAEEAVLGSAILNEKIAAIVVSLLKEEFFLSKTNSEVFKAIAELLSDGKTIDLVSVCNKCFGKVESISSISKLTDSAVIFESKIEDHCEIVKENYLKRSAVSVAKRLIKDCEQNLPINEIVDSFGNSFFRLTGENNNNAASVGEIAKIVHQNIVNISNGNHVNGISTGFIDIDKRIAGLSPKKLIIVAARPGMGKSIYAMNIAVNAAMKKNKVMFFSLEMGKEELVQRMISSLSNVDADSIRKGYTDNEFWKKVNRATGKIEELPIIIDDSAALSISDIIARAKIESIKGDVKLIIVDYLQLMSAKAQSREQEVSIISRGLKRLAKDLNVPVVALSQLNRSLENRADKHPALSDLRESGAIEQDADVVQFIYRDKYYDEKSLAGNVAEIITAKQRGGPTGTDKLFFSGEYQRFDNLEKFNNQ